MFSVNLINDVFKAITPDDYGENERQTSSRPPCQTAVIGITKVCLGIKVAEEEKKRLGVSRERLSEM